MLSPIQLKQKSPLSSDVSSTYEEFRRKKANVAQGHMPLSEERGSCEIIQGT